MSKSIIDYEGRSPVNNAWDAFVKSKRTSLQWVSSKIAKIRGLKVTKTEWDVKNKSLRIKVLVNNDEVQDLDLTYAEICSELKWKSFRIIDGGSCIPVELTYDEIAEMYKDSIAKTKLADFRHNRELEKAAKKADSEKVIGHLSDV